MPEGQRPTPLGGGNKVILDAREAHYYDCLIQVRARIADLQRQHGSWSRIPNRLRTDLANNLRFAGFNYQPGIGWTPLNSVSLSSL